MTLISASLSAIINKSSNTLTFFFASYVNTVFPRTSAPARLKGEVLIGRRELNNGGAY